MTINCLAFTLLPLPTIGTLALLFGTVGTNWMNGKSLAEMFADDISCLGFCQRSSYYGLYQIGFIIAANVFCIGQWIEIFLMNRLWPISRVKRLLTGVASTFGSIGLIVMAKNGNPIHIIAAIIAIVFLILSQLINALDWRQCMRCTQVTQSVLCCQKMIVVAAFVFPCLSTIFFILWGFNVTAPHKVSWLFSWAEWAGLFWVVLGFQIKTLRAVVILKREHNADKSRDVVEEVDVKRADENI